MTPSNATSRALLALLLVALAALGPAASASAASNQACGLDPIALPLFDATPAATIAATPGTSAGAPEPTEAEMREAADRIVACSNDSSQAVRYSVFTDRYLASRFLGDEPADQPAFERMIATGALPQDDTWKLDDVNDIEPRPDGRVAVTLHLSSGDAAIADRLVLAWDAEQGAWLIDDVLALNSEATPAS
jgi:hypothetical protein